MRLIRYGTILTVAAVLSGCGDRSDGGDGTSSPAGAAWLLENAPADAQSVLAVKAAAGEGDKVVMRGRIGGRADPISPDSGIFILVDPSLPTCADNPEDSCPRPWDYCCEEPQKVAASAATVQLSAAAGTPAFRQLKPMDEVVVVGTVAPRSGNQTLLVMADQVHVAPGR